MESASDPASTVIYGPGRAVSEKGAPAEHGGRYTYNSGAFLCGQMRVRVGREICDLTTVREVAFTMASRELLVDALLAVIRHHVGRGHRFSQQYDPAS